MLNEIVGDILSHIRDVESLYQSRLSWERKYHAIFHLHREKIRVELVSVGLQLDWHDPDTSYEEDVRAYMKALLQLKGELETIGKEGE